MGVVSDSYGGLGGYRDGCGGGSECWTRPWGVGRMSGHFLSARRRH